MRIDPSWARLQARGLAEEIARLLVAWLAASALGWVLWHFGRAGWSIYAHTAIGARFVEGHPVFAAHAEALFALSAPLQLAASISAELLAAALAVGCALELVGLRALVYQRLPWLARGLWGAGLAWALAEPIAARHDLAATGLAMLVALPPASVVTPAAMATAGALMPNLPARLLGWAEELRARWRDRIR